MSVDTSPINEIEQIKKEYEEKIKEMTNENKKQIEEVKRLKGLILKQEEAQTEIVSGYEEQISRLQKNTQIIEKQKEEIEELKQENKELQKSIEIANNEIEKQKKIIQTLSGIGRKMKEDQEKIIKEKVTILEEELEQTKKENQRKAKENEELNTQIKDITNQLKEMDEIKQLNVQRNETITKLYEENETLKKTVENFTQDLQNKIMNETYYVDKRIINKLLISYITKPHQRMEIVNLMSKIMDFTEEEKRLLGLSQETTQTGLFSYFFGKTDEYDEPPKYDLKDKTFGDLWVEFLLRESGSLDAQKPTNQK
ncbi:GRIP domain-containing protein RUD3, putative [Entamoeba dispar SAW760]|uniref:GRIP domain-containing protein RUD3, putative n=1 Tax=Entamoeba dispar (strain ATCC PRA-260 / SAW760) TaxID=370354 RepID=B0EAP7_ENTDS|nr:GRIP domain-containing protein RUD3, putative [Entamoeba dispar SAW760]EDR28396.1 GRIP domain-containing protein RUD3, putative [Entamoeba dispar SAW760]|eukprot:EDR28396.1 GRIP domain-containing protein RUD3, putative [Entamoeba dispar SAW760]